MHRESASDIVIGDGMVQSDIDEGERDEELLVELGDKYEGKRDKGGDRAGRSTGYCSTARELTSSRRMHVRSHFRNLRSLAVSRLCAALDADLDTS